MIPGDGTVMNRSANSWAAAAAVRSWISAAMAQTPVTMGRWGIRVALLALAKQPIPDKLFTPMYVVTKDNADKVDISAVRQPKGWRPPL